MLHNQPLLWTGPRRVRILFNLAVVGASRCPPQSVIRYAPMGATPYILFAVGAFVSLLNFYLSFLRFPVHAAFGGTRASYRHVSGFPIVGSGLLWLCLPFLPSNALRWVAAVMSAFDTGGLHWFLFALWRQGELGAFIRGGRDGA